MKGSTYLCCREEMNKCLHRAQTYQHWTTLVIEAGNIRSSCCDFSREFICYQVTWHVRNVTLSYFCSDVVRSTLAQDDKITVLIRPVQHVHSLGRNIHRDDEITNVNLFPPIESRLQQSCGPPAIVSPHFQVALHTGVIAESSLK